ncbi:MAG TPA: LysR family transcriptional regulator [Xanthobacteraceae bacterium]|jgi:DNA-binding transcriptional LysR family regulator
MAPIGKIDLLRGLEIFLALADSGSMTEAARLLGITQPAVSQQLKLLEAELGARLVDRHQRPLRLTPSGVTLRRRAAQLLQQADRTRAEMRHSAAGPLPHLRIAMFSTLAKTLAPAIVAEVINRKLKIRTVSIMRGMAAYQGQELLRRDVDVVITSDALYDVEGMERHELIQEDFVLMLPRAMARKSASLREIARHKPLIRYSGRTEAGRLIERHLRRQRLDIPQTFSFDAPDELFAMVAMGHGWTITAPTHVVHALEPGAAVELRALPKPSLGRGITLVARAGELGDLPARLARLCRQVLQREYVPRMRSLMPALADHFTVVQEGSDDSAA